jgi:hypothetical protein
MLFVVQGMYIMLIAQVGYLIFNIRGYKKWIKLETMNKKDIRSIEPSVSQKAKYDVLTGKFEWEDK